MKLKSIGKRTIKTGLAVGLSIFIAQLLNLNSPFFAGIAAIIAMESSISESLERGKDRMYATVLGGIVALIFSLIAPENPIFISLGVILIIYISDNLDIKGSLQLATIVFLSIILNYEEGSRLSYAVNRVIDTFLGLIVGTMVNYFVFPHKFNNKVKQSFISLYYELKSNLEYIVWNKVLVLDKVRENLFDAESEYKILKKEIKYQAVEDNFSFDFAQVFELYESAYVNINILAGFEGEHIINLENKLALEELFQREVPLKEDRFIKNKNDIVFNYHLSKLLNELSDIRYIFNLKD